MLPLIVSASAIAYIAKTKAPKMQLEAAKNDFIKQLRTERDALDDLLNKFESQTDISPIHRAMWQKPFELLSEPNPTNFSHYNRALKHNSCIKKLNVYYIVLNLESKIRAITDPELLQWFREQIAVLIKFIHELYFDYSTVSYASTGMLMERLDTVRQDVIDCQQLLEFTESLLDEYLEGILHTVINYPISMEEQETLKNKLLILKSLMSKKTASWKNIYERREEINGILHSLSIIQDPALRHRFLSSWARIRTQLALDCMELHFFQLAKDTFFGKKQPDIYLQNTLLYAYAASIEMFRNFYESRFVQKDVHVPGIDVLFSFENTDFLVPRQVLIDIKRTALLFEIPFPDYEAVFVGCEIQDDEYYIEEEEEEISEQSNLEPDFENDHNLSPIAEEMASGDEDEQSDLQELQSDIEETPFYETEEEKVHYDAQPDSSEYEPWSYQASTEEPMIQPTRVPPPIPPRPLHFMVRPSLAPLQEPELSQRPSQHSPANTM